jgi:hypothetical protein
MSFREVTHCGELHGPLGRQGLFNFNLNPDHPSPSESRVSDGREARPVDCQHRAGKVSTALRLMSCRLAGRTCRQNSPAVVSQRKVFGGNSPAAVPSHHDSSDHRAAPRGQLLVGPNHKLDSRKRGDLGPAQKSGSAAQRLEFGHQACLSRPGHGAPRLLRLGGLPVLLCTHRFAKNLNAGCVVAVIPTSLAYL